MKEKKVVVLLVAITMMTLALASCKKSDDSLNNTETTRLAQETTTVLETTTLTLQETTTVQDTITSNATSSAVNQFSTTAGSSYDVFYANSVFVGDSVMYGFERYIKARPGTLGSPFFLTAGSFAARIELAPVTNESPHPVYMGQKMHVSDALSLIGADKVFLFFGLNDIGLLGVDQTVINYQGVIDSIRAKNPDIKIYIISTTYMAAGSELRTLNNANIRLLNEKLAANAPAWGVGYIDVAQYMCDSQGCLAAGYSSDGYVHINSAAYDLWVGVLRDYASKN